MARKRMIDPEFWSDEEIGKWDFETRLFYIGLWNFADDEGRLKAHNELLKSQIFPYDRKIDIQKLKINLNGKVIWYEYENCQYGYVKNFSKYQVINHPSKSQLPKPPSLLPEHYGNANVTIPHNLKEVNLKEVNLNHQQPANAGVSFTVTQLKEMFDKIWVRYPRREGRSEAYRHFAATIKNEQDYKNIKIALVQYVNYITKEKIEPKYIKHGSTWFNNWKDWIEDPNKINDKTKELVI